VMKRARRGMRRLEHTTQCETLLAAMAAWYIARKCHTAISSQHIQEITRLALSCSMPWIANAYDTGRIYRKSLRKFRPESRKCTRNNLTKCSSTYLRLDRSGGISVNRSSW
jgi:hypothetical protein